MIFQQLEHTEIRHIFKLLFGEEVEIHQSEFLVVAKRVLFTRAVLAMSGTGVPGEAQPRIFLRYGTWVPSEAKPLLGTIPAGGEVANAITYPTTGDGIPIDRMKADIDNFLIMGNPPR